ncbi:MAG: hypothetical protein PVG53_10765 [Holophagae bacterium]|jgi:hypothetical protein
MSCRASGLLAVVVLCAGPVLGQDERLADVAGKITLNPDAVVAKQGFADDPRAVIKADGELLGSMLTECRVTADLIVDLFDQARATYVPPDDEIAIRLRDASAVLDDQLQGIGLLRLSESFNGVMETVRRTADDCAAASAAARTVLVRRGAAFDETGDLLARCRTLLTRSSEQLDAIVAGSSGRGTSALPSAMLSDDELVERVCGAPPSRGAAEVEACRSRQYRALAAIESRTAENEMVDGEIFSEIRRVCADKHPRDFDQRDSCEMSRLTAIRLEAR